VYTYIIYSYLLISSTEKEESGEAPKFTKPLKPVIAEAQSPATLKATVTGRPTPSICWYRGKEEILPDNGHTMEFNPTTGECVLSISEATPQDEAVYSVKAVNTFGRAECRANLVLSEYLLCIFNDSLPLRPAWLACLVACLPCKR
jgi:Immunoglobulin I-set domain.